ncbi:ABC transporter ATP-binding protein [Exiguobacterium sp. RIT452]|uniref:ABC transporter ATP-binding protein n=1 Tax=Exiguobacterium sp. RIT452 TaxID=2315552 RepID=UPI000E71EF6B|nr:ABC transporter ATP-binding protein [Exiguobacterium sp. RIT452]RJO98965.1 ABC transporter ATP-binding protein [Exiguobacterium sp. RIT452]
MIHLDHVTKKFAPKRGLFDVSFTVEPGMVFGFIGPNGAGKSTAIRQLMGLIQADTGRATIGGFDCWDQSEEVKRLVGYLPGEINLPGDFTGEQVLQLMQKLHHSSPQRQQELLNRFPFETKTKIRKMSKGMKQKLALVGCFMKDAPVYLLDEPTSGLDPLMQEHFLDLIDIERQRGKAILMSSHHFPEMEKSCDRAALIKEGRIIVEADIHELVRSSRKQYTIEFGLEAEAEQFALQIGSQRLQNQVSFVTGHELTLNQIIHLLTAYDVRTIQSSADDLEHVFLHYYGEEGSS